MGHKAVILLVAMLGGRSAAAEPRSAGFSIMRIEPAALPAAATKTDVGDLLVGSAWHHPNPEKKTSDWERQTFVFRADGTLEITTHHLGGPGVARKKWRVVRAGSRPVVSFGGKSRRLAVCAKHDQSTTLCLF